MRRPVDCEGKEERPWHARRTSQDGPGEADAWREAQLASSVDVLGVMRERMYAQVLALTHERASIEELMPYHSIRLGPMPVLEMMGRSRALDPTCPRDASVFHWWKERLRAQTTAIHTCSPRESESVSFAVSTALALHVPGHSFVATL